MPGKLFIVSTPIGNLEDVTFRAVRTLKEVDLIACEDTRHTKKLLNYYNLSTPTTSYHEHNEIDKSNRLLSELKKGKNIAIVSDAGTPCISDPGFRIVKLASENSIKIHSIPGPSAVISGLTLAGLPLDSFIFFGFIPRTKRKIIEFFERIKNLEQTLIFYESPNRILKTLEYSLELLGNRETALCREMTKLHEEILRGKTNNLIIKLKDKTSIKGEFTVVIEGRKMVSKGIQSKNLNDIDKRLKILKNLGLSLKDAVKVTSEDIKFSKKKIYERALYFWDN